LKFVHFGFRWTTGWYKILFAKYLTSKKMSGFRSQSRYSKVEVDFGMSAMFKHMYRLKLDFRAGAEANILGNCNGFGSVNSNRC
jgi:hypothetical protein